MLTKTEHQKRAEFLAEGREALVRQFGGPFDRGDGATVMSVLDSVLTAIANGELVWTDCHRGPGA